MGAVSRLADRQHTEVVAAAAAGDEYAFRRIIAAHHDDMRRVCLAISGDHALAEEATQAAWVVAWKKLGKVRGPDHLRPWLVAVAVNEAKHLLRSRRRRSDFEISTDASGILGHGDPAAGIDLVDLWTAVRRMEPDDRALLTMRYGMGFDSNELAVATGKTPVNENGAGCSRSIWRTSTPSSPRSRACDPESRR
jgi:RNA polymerase sigma-70 factor, ECF subfamily